MADELTPGLRPDKRRKRLRDRLSDLLAELPPPLSGPIKVEDDFLRFDLNTCSIDLVNLLEEATSPADGEARLRRLVTDLERSYPSAAACLGEDLPALCVHLAYPLRLRTPLRSTNLLERSLEEVKRRTKVIGRFPGETSCLSLCLGGARPVHRQRSRTRSHRAGAPPNWRRCAPPAPLHRTGR
jgi:hypothetical protein